MTIAVVGGTVIDGAGGEPLPDGVVLIEGERIAAVGPASQVALPKGAEVLDAGGRWVMPGIVDSHVHTTYRARDMRQHLLNTPTYNVLRSTTILEETLACGVTSVRDMGGADAGFRAAVEEGIVPGPRMMISLVMISQTGGHGDYWLPAGHRIAKRSWLPDPVADGVDGVRRLVRQVLAAGADFIKICATGGITSVTDSWDEPQFTVEELSVAVAEAAAKRKRVAVHAEGIDGIRSTLDAGAWSLEHGWFIDEESVDRMIAQGTWWVPTLALVPMSVRKRETDKAWSAQQLAKEDAKDSEIFGLMQKQIPLYREAVKRGVKVAFGTDQSHRLLVGDNLVELEFMVDWLGMTPLEALTAATARAAECLERDDIGLLAPGRYADLLVVEGAPLDDITCLQKRGNLRLVMKGGQAYSNSLTA
ncbi:Imidazolonepropionase [Tistlia consotensis]|uniref:Imidazolonepropionase n=1 Tax=Tistlia consotensis USBA 355 TaxID=560819 RepID=A0A1Y6CDH9_9PROT|nr:amidohydrolase family protein [Tistlia consotensis]SMF48700.1 Imidazolonepropionase [Tistlia consotensis USBA 355]SNR80871.1 Imidazolonepropionase [Tistlia consotensis]